MATYYGPAFGPPKQTYQGPVAPGKNEAVFRSTGQTVSNPKVLGATTGGGGGGGGNPQPAQAFSSQGAPEIPQPGMPQIDFDALIAPALEGLDAAVGPLNQSYESNVQSINSARTNQLAANSSAITGQTNTLNQAKTTQESQAKNAADEARRQYAEIQQGLQSRYGGTTGTGAFAGELAGRQTLQNMGQTREQLSQAILQIDQKKQQVEEVGRIAAQEIEDKTRDQLNQAKNQLDTALADIRRQKGELQARKAELAANAIQLYQNTVNQVNAQNAAFKQNIYLAQMQAAQQLEAARQTGTQNIQSFASSIPGINAAQQSTPVGAQQTAQANAAQLGGAGSLGQQGGDFYNTYLKQLGLQ